LINAFSAANKLTEQISSRFPVFHFTKNVKYGDDMTFIEVYGCQNSSK